MALGEAEVRALIRISRYGTIAGSYVTSGTIRRGASVRIIRDGAILHETSIDSLKRFKEDVREVAEGFECGIHLEGFDDVKEGDVLEVFEIRQVERTALDESARPPRRNVAPPPNRGWGLTLHPRARRYRVPAHASGTRP